MGGMLSTSIMPLVCLAAESVSPHTTARCKYAVTQPVSSPVDMRSIHGLNTLKSLSNDFPQAVADILFQFTVTVCSYILSNLRFCLVYLFESLH